MKRHESAIVDPNAQIADDVDIGPYCIVGPKVKLGPGCSLLHHVAITGNTTIGSQNRFFPFSAIGGDPQDLKYLGGDTELHIGDRNVFRECVTVNVGTEAGGGVTRIGCDNYLMACSHIAHDCEIGDYVIFANAVCLGGHARVGSHAKIMGLVGVSPFGTVGEHAYVGGLTRAIHDIPPFMIIEGNPAKVRQVNVIGLERAGFDEERIEALREAHRVIFRPEILNRRQVLDELERSGDLTEDVKHLIDFLKEVDKGRAGRAREALRGQHG